MATKPRESEVQSHLNKTRGLSVSDALRIIDLNPGHHKHERPKYVIPGRPGRNKRPLKKQHLTLGEL